VQFNRLRLAGFKSFVDATELVVEPGLSGVVGPNGCGKSNLVEALKWVMGETSPKNMRGGAMDDVIFAGTSNRPARNIAEVVLELDNADRSAPAAMNDADELMISRQIERESGSRYRINGREMRARDVQLLFADAATGAHSPAMVSQGRVGTLINAKARDRRAILEEAAGISGLHSRRHEAELRLRGAETNLVRLEDVTGQIETQLQSLKRQSRQATRYRKVNEQIRHLEATLLYLRWRDASEAVRVAEQELQAAENRVREATGGAAAASTVQVTLQQELPGLRQSEAEAAAAVHRLVVEREGLDAEAQRLAETRARLQSSLAQIAQDVERDTAQSKDAETALARLDTEKQEIETATARKGDIEAEARTRMESAEAVLAIQEKEWDELSERTATLFARKRELDQQLSETGDRAGRLRQKLAGIDTERDQLGVDDAQIARAEQAAAGVTAARRALDQATHDLEESQTTRADAQVAEAAARGTLDETNGVLTGINAEIAALNKLLAVDEDDLWPALLDEIEADPGYEAALGAALGDDLNAPSDEGAPVHWAQRANSGPDAPALPDGASPLDEHVRAPVVLLRRLKQIGIVSEAEGPKLAAHLAQGQRLVSQQGSLWRWDGFTANHEAATPAAIRLAQRNQLKEQEELRPEAAELAAHAKTRFDQLKAAVEAATAVERTARDAWQAAGKAMDAAQSDFADATNNASDHHKRAAALAEAEARVGDDLKETEARAVTLEAERAELPDGDGLRSALNEKREAVEKHRADYTEAKSALGILDREERARCDRLEAIGQERAAWDARVEGALRHLNELNTRQGAAEEELKRLEDEPQRIESNRLALAERVDQAEDIRKQAADTLAEAEGKLAEADKVLKQIQEVLALAREDRVRIEAARDQGTERRDGIADRIREVLGCQPEQVPETADFAEDDEFPPADQMDIRIERLKRERENIGAVNLRAEQESQELDEQLQTLLTERADLESAISRLRQGIGSLNREGRERLLTAFTQVNDHFSELFVRLFGGGQAHLELTESDDPLEAGLEIMASPPGKRMQVLSLLSGGEQALTALALIFAVFLTNPAPICVLDEVDAPLDDANVDRFCLMLREIADATQTRFLIVTHNVVTMSRMDRLFGVTMSERGVSNLVSVDLRQAEDLAAVG